VTRGRNPTASLCKQSVAVASLDLQRQYATIRDDEVEQFEREVAGLIGVPVAVGCASGTDALWLALLAAGVRPGDGVITSAFSFLASASSIARAGARPVFVDIDPSTFNS
jgi:dTDP-4-amino-4,6-dideoxygalactose transaminase